MSSKFPRRRPIQWIVEMIATVVYYSGHGDTAHRMVSRYYQ